MAGRRRIEPVDDAPDAGTAMAPAPAPGRGQRYTAKRRAAVEPDPEEFEPEAEAEAPPYAGADDEEGEEDEDIEGMNNPDVESFGEAPLIGGRAQTTDIYGSEAEAVGRVSSPRLYAQAAQFPTAVQFRCWKWENGIPTALGPISVEASEEDFIQRFYDAMPMKGDGRGQYRFRPVDIRGKELGKEFTITISEHHAELIRIRKQKAAEKEEAMGNGRGRDEPLIINQGNDGAGSAYAEEMGRMFEQAVGSSERRTELLQQTLEEERNRLREEEKSRYTERADLAARASDVTVKLTEKLMQTDRSRSEEQIKAQAAQSGLLMNTLTTVFAQQQSTAQQSAERQREADAAAAERQRLADAAKMSQDREFFERQRIELETRRAAEREEMEARRSFEKDEAERKRLTEKDEAERKHITERDEAERKRAIEKDEAERKYRLQVEEWERKRTQDKEEADRRVETERQRLDLEKVRLEEQRKYELEQLRVEAQKLATEGERRRSLEQMESDHRRERDREESQRRETEADRRRQADKEETSLRLEREKMELARQQEIAKAEREFQQQQAKEERERWRFEMEEKRRSETEAWERKRAQEKEDSERRERADRERIERERADFQLRMEREKQEAERAENRRREELELARQDFLLRIEKEKSETERAASARREEMQREADRRREEMALQQKAMDLSSQRDREHAERLMEMARMEREAAREAQATREKNERDARESAERERQRQMDFALKQLEADKQAQREHAERLHQANKQQAQGGFGSLAETLGMETPELLARIYGGNQREDDGEEKGGGWADAIPKVLGSIAELGAVALKAKAEANHAEQRGRRQLPENVQIVQTPNGPQVLLPGNATGIPMVRQQARPQPVPQQQQVRSNLPDMPHLPPEFANENDAPAPQQQQAQQQQAQPKQATPAPTPKAEATPEPEAEPEAAPINTLARAKEAGLSLLDQRKARKALRNLMIKLSNAEQDDWLGIVTEAIGANLGIYHYIKAVSVRAALAEVTPDTEFHTKVVDMMKNSGMIPDDVPYDEADYARLHGDK